MTRSSPRMGDPSVSASKVMGSASTNRPLLRLGSPRESVTRPTTSPMRMIDEPLCKPGRRRRRARALVGEKHLLEPRQRLARRLDHEQIRAETTHGTRDGIGVDYGGGTQS